MIPSLAAVPARFHRLLRLCLARDLRQRLRDISAARLLLDEPGSSDVRAISRPWVAASVVAAAALAGALAATWIAPRFRPAQPPAGVVRFQIPISEKTPLVNSSVFAVSPDGSKLTYYARGGEAMVLWVRSMDSLESPELPGTDTLNGSAAPIFWSPDSRCIAFQGLRGLMKVEARSGPAQTVCTLAGSTAGGSWSRDGVILFAHNAGAVMRGKKSGSYRL